MVAGSLTQTFTAPMIDTLTSYCSTSPATTVTAVETFKPVLKIYNLSEKIHKISQNIVGWIIITFPKRCSGVHFLHPHRLRAASSLPDFNYDSCLTDWVKTQAEGTVLSTSNTSQ